MSDLYEVIDSSAAKFGHTHGLFSIRRGLRFRAPEARGDADVKESGPKAKATNLAQALEHI